MNSFNYNKLKGRIKEKVETQRNLALKMNTSPTLLSFKLNHKVDFSMNDIYKMVNILEIPKDEIYDYFFSRFS